MQGRTKKQRVSYIGDREKFLASPIPYNFSAVWQKIIRHFGTCFNTLTATQNN